MPTELEVILVSSYKKDMIIYLNNHPEYFEEAVRLAIASKKPFSKKAAYLLWSCMEMNDERIRKHIPYIISSLKDRSDDHFRELLIILEKMDLNDENLSELFDICERNWLQITKRPSVRYHSMKMMTLIAQRHPGLVQELTLICNDQYLEGFSPSAKKSILKFIDNLA